MHSNQDHLNIALYTEGLQFSGNTIENEALGGSESAFIYLGRSLVDLGHQVMAFCHCPDEGLYEGVSYYDISNWSDHGVNQHWDVFICSRYFHVFQHQISAQTKILWCHDLLDKESATGIMEVASEIDFIFCLSDFHLYETANLLPFLQQKLRRTQNGVDLDMIATVQKSIRLKRHKIMFTSRPERGLAEALEVYKMIDDQKLEFVICTYSYVNDYHWHTTQKEVEKLRREGFNIRTENFSKKQLYYEIAESKCVIYPANFLEISCISALEAQACGTAFLTRGVGALTETVHAAGIVDASTQVFANALKSILDNEDVRISLETIGQNHVENFTWKQSANCFLREIKQHITRLQSKEIANTFSSKLIQKPVILPRISCLCVTKNRIILLKQAIRCFLDQTYPNKELIIVATGNKTFCQALSSYIKLLDNQNIVLQWVDESLTLGAKRNLSIKASQKEIICTWDDDDLYHPQRLEKQYALMIQSGSQACFLGEHLHYFEQKMELAWVDYGYQGRMEKDAQIFNPTMMLIYEDSWKYDEDGPHSNIGEDSAFIDKFRDEIPICSLFHNAYLYLYRYHGDNTMTEEHHQGITNYGIREIECFQAYLSQMQETLKYHRLPQRAKLIDRIGREIYVKDFLKLEKASMNYHPS